LGNIDHYHCAVGWLRHYKRNRSDCNFHRRSCADNNSDGYSTCTRTVNCHLNTDVHRHSDTYFNTDTRRHNATDFDCNAN
jgi:hypothetical protein